MQTCRIHLLGKKVTQVRCARQRITANGNFDNLYRAANH